MYDDHSNPALGFLYHAAVLAAYDYEQQKGTFPSQRLTEKQKNDGLDWGLVNGLVEIEDRVGLVVPNMGYPEMRIKIKDTTDTMGLWVPANYKRSRYASGQ